MNQAPNERLRPSTHHIPSASSSGTPQRATFDKSATTANKDAHTRRDPKPSYFPTLAHPQLRIHFQAPRRRRRSPPHPPHDAPRRPVVVPHPIPRERVAPSPREPHAPHVPIRHAAARYQPGHQYVGLRPGGSEEDRSASVAEYEQGQDGRVAGSPNTGGVRKPDTRGMAG